MARGGGWWGLGLLASLALGGSGCSPDSAPEPAPRPSPNLILISIDTLRADHLGAYGYSRPTSPRLDALAAESLLFTSAYAPAPWTLPSHAALLTGVHPWDLGFDNPRRTLPETVPTLAEGLAAHGYNTAAFVDSTLSGFVGADRGFDRGFDLYRHGPHSPGARQRFDVASTVDAALSWLDGRDVDRPFFLFLHTKSVHALAAADPCRDERCLPYDQPEPHRLRFIDPETPSFRWRSEDGSAAAQAYLWTLNEKIVNGELDPRQYPRERLEVLIAAYDAGIRWVDDELGRLVDSLRARGRLSDTVLVVTSDHGESFLEEDLLLHQELAEATLRVPLIFRLPDEDRVAGTSSVFVALEDVTPTLLDLAGAAVPERVAGRPLPLDTASASPRDLFSYYLFPGRFRFQAFALQRGARRLVIDNLTADGSQRTRWLGTGDAEREAVERALFGRMRSQPAVEGVEIEQGELAKQQDVLRGLGYIE